MSLIKFNKNGSLLDCKLEPEGHRLRIISEQPVVGIKQLIEEGFVELNEHTQAEMVDFSDERYLYHEEEKEHVFVITNEENDVWEPQPYVPPTPTPEPEPYVPPISEVKAQKIAEMETQMTSIIASGVTVTLFDETTGVFGLSQEDQIFLTNLRMMAESAEDQDTPSIPWHEIDDAKHCKFYAPRDIIAITDAARELITYHITFFRDLRIYINSLLTVEAVNAVTYDLDSLPQAYWSEVLRSIVS